MMKNFTFAAMAALLASSAMAINTEPVIDAEGEEVLYTQYMNGYSFGFQEDLELKDAAIYFADDNKVYFLNMDGMDYDTFVVGEKKGNKIEVVLPQLVADEGIMRINFTVVEPVPTPEDILDLWGEEIDPYYAPVKDAETVVTFTIAEDGTITLDTLPDNKGIGSVEVPNLSYFDCMYAITEMKYTPNIPTAVDSVENTTVSEEYYDLSGRYVANPSEGGIYVKIATKADGSRKINKVFK